MLPRPVRNGQFPLRPRHDTPSVYAIEPSNEGNGVWAIRGKLSPDDLEHIPREDRTFDPQDILTAYRDWTPEEVAENLERRVATEMLTPKEAQGVYCLFLAHVKKEQVTRGLGKATTKISAEV